MSDPKLTSIKPAEPRDRSGEAIVPPEVQASGTEPPEKAGAYVEAESSGTPAPSAESPGLRSASGLFDPPPPDPLPVGARFLAHSGDHEIVVLVEEGPLARKGKTVVSQSRHLVTLREHEPLLKDAILYGLDDEGDPHRIGFWFYDREVGLFRFLSEESLRVDDSGRYVFEEGRLIGELRPNDSDSTTPTRLLTHPSYIDFPGTVSFGGARTFVGKKAYPTLERFLPRLEQYLNTETGELILPGRNESEITTTIDLNLPGLPVPMVAVREPGSLYDIEIAWGSEATLSMLFNPASSHADVKGVLRRGEKAVMQFSFSWSGDKGRYASARTDQFAAAVMSSIGYFRRSLLAPRPMPREAGTAFPFSLIDIRFFLEQLLPDFKSQNNIPTFERSTPNIRLVRYASFDKTFGQLEITFYWDKKLGRFIIHVHHPQHASYSGNRAGWRRRYGNTLISKMNDLMGKIEHRFFRGVHEIFLTYAEENSWVLRHAKNRGGDALVMTGDRKGPPEKVMDWVPSIVWNRTEESADSVSGSIDPIRETFEGYVEKNAAQRAVPASSLAAMRDFLHGAISRTPLGLAAMMTINAYYRRQLSDGEERATRRTDELIQRILSTISIAYQNRKKPRKIEQGADLGQLFIGLALAEDNPALGNELLDFSTTSSVATHMNRTLLKACRGLALALSSGEPKKRDYREMLDLIKKQYPEKYEKQILRRLEIASLLPSHPVAQWMRERGVGDKDWLTPLAREAASAPRTSDSEAPRHGLRQGGAVSSPLISGDAPPDPIDNNAPKAFIEDRLSLIGDRGSFAIAADPIPDDNRQPISDSQVPLFQVVGVEQFVSAAPVDFNIVGTGTPESDMLAEVGGYPVEVTEENSGILSMQQVTAPGSIFSTRPVNFALKVVR